jgi:hypothetical protein
LINTTKLLDFCFLNKQKTWRIFRIEVEISFLHAEAYFSWKLGSYKTQRLGFPAVDIACSFTLYWISAIDFKSGGDQIISSNLYWKTIWAADLKLNGSYQIPCLAVTAGNPLRKHSFHIDMVFCYGFPKHDARPNKCLY